MSVAKPIAIYGFNITVPDDEPLDFIHDVDTFNETLVEPIQVYFITPSLPMNGISDVQVIIGFTPENNLSTNMIHLDSLHECIIDNPMFDGIELDEKPGFYTGFIWKDDISSELESESELDSDDCESSTGSDDISESSEISDDCESSSSNDESLSHYISKYYI